MKARTDKFADFAPPLWVTVAVAAALAAWLLATFVDTLHAHLRHGDELRQAQLAAARAPAFAVAADVSEARVAQLKLR